MSSASVPADKNSMIRKIACAVGLLFASSAFLIAGTDSSSWKKGLVISADMNGHGPTQDANEKRDRGQQDIWWNYLITAECFSYSVVSRRSPSEAGLQPNNPVKFSENKNRIYVRDRDGRLLSLRIFSKHRSPKCR
jgi:hypothetical protein